MSLLDSMAPTDARGRLHVGWRLHDAPRHRASLVTLLVACLTAGVVLGILLYPPLASTAPLGDSPRLQAASFTVTTPARPGVDQRGLATAVAPETDGGLALRGWTARDRKSVV